jgi:hypothetical protein
MRVRFSAILVVALLFLAPASWAQLAPYSQDFEGLTPAPQPTDPFESSLTDDGWLFFANGFDAFGNYLFGYGPFGAPNHGEAISAVVMGEGGPMQGAQQLSVFSNYFDPVHGACDGLPPGDSSSPSCIFLETNVFKEQIIGADDVGTTWRFEFDAKRGNIEGATTALAFFKVLNPFTGYSLTEFLWVDMTGITNMWAGHSLSILIGDWEGQILQFGFLNTATDYEGSGIYYDNVAFGPAPLGVAFDVKPGSCPNPINPRSHGVLPVAVLGTTEFDVHDIDVDTLLLAGVSPLNSSYEDVAEPYMGDMCGCAEAEPDGFDDLTLKFKTQEVVEALGSLPGGDAVLTLTGALLDGTPIEGQDCVIKVGGGGAGMTGVARERWQSRSRAIERSDGSTRLELQPK